MESAKTNINKSGDLTEKRPFMKALSIMPYYANMIASGEKSGELDNMLIRSADNQDNEFERQVSMALSIFEPMLIVSMASVVLFIVLSILEPILKMNSMV